MILILSLPPFFINCYTFLVFYFSYKNPLNIESPSEIIKPNLFLFFLGRDNSTVNYSFMPVSIDFIFEIALQVSNPSIDNPFLYTLLLFL